VQRFEGGAVFWCAEYDAVPVTGAILRLLDENPAVQERLGFPVTGPQTLRSFSDDRIQFFEGGTVTVTDGQGRMLATACALPRG
jgi:hypothetical protein